jgi:hypothetical protein
MKKDVSLWTESLSALHRTETKRTTTRKKKNSPLLALGVRRWTTRRRPCGSQGRKLWAEAEAEAVGE